MPEYPNPKSQKDREFHQLGLPKESNVFENTIVILKFLSNKHLIIFPLDRQYIVTCCYKT